MHCTLHCLQQQSAAKHKHRNEEMMSEVTQLMSENSQLREKVAEKEKESLELQVSCKYISTYTNVHTQYLCMHSSTWLYSHMCILYVLYSSL